MNDSQYCYFFDEAEFVETGRPGFRRRVIRGENLELWFWRIAGGAPGSVLHNHDDNEQLGENRYDGKNSDNGLTISDIAVERGRQQSLNQWSKGNRNDDEEPALLASQLLPESCDHEQSNVACMALRANRIPWISRGALKGALT